jgi:YtkA-like
VSPLSAMPRSEQRRKRPARSVGLLLGLAIVAAVIRLAGSDPPPATAVVERAALSHPVGPGPVDVQRSVSGFALRISINPNRAGTQNSVRMVIRAHGRPVRHAKVTVTFTMQAMAMGTMRFPMPESPAGVYRYTGPAPMMAGDWRLSFRVKPSAGPSAALTVSDRVD